jgi:hypothetical protein
MTFKELMWRSCIGRKEVAAMLGKSERTISDWCKHGAPIYAEERLSLLAGIHPDWQGIRILPGEVELPSGVIVSKNEIEQIPWMKSLMAQMSQSARSEAKKATLITELATAANDETAVNIYIDAN